MAASAQLSAAPGMITRRPAAIRPPAAAAAAAAAANIVAHPKPKAEPKPRSVRQQQQDSSAALEAASGHASGYDDGPELSAWE
jgi:hypothetical protein